MSKYCILLCFEDPNSSLAIQLYSGKRCHPKRCSSGAGLITVLNVSVMGAEWLLQCWCAGDVAWKNVSVGSGEFMKKS
ncbi:uncharacterized protein LACBIDRAFT_311080 [Laccaria bicolor S238N-H82]|uniref:Predicted protein n=1 Tax=Laccaria bicolor (strain S238N-H82 / ATCC MYA-4686) TaxID=486041 RepID=B0CZ69_LACBS|nr:uncharacterized protein LACBIDRAFT_311080 [Laccaria bicolor S238N-H82]EDR12567.1 predicted protein [Laccaria bicolor S238N-H82]|eukprot:XP_001876831.1 predicted protein [Laccaria bicolor S238N-H82]